MARQFPLNCFFSFVTLENLASSPPVPTEKKGFNEPNRSRVAPLTEMLNDLHDNGPPEESLDMKFTRVVPHILSRSTPIVIAVKYDPGIAQGVWVTSSMARVSGWEPSFIVTKHFLADRFGALATNQWWVDLNVNSAHGSLNRENCMLN